MANDVKWVKMTTDMFDNRKIKHLRRLPDGNNIVLIWVMLLTMAGRCNANGMIFLTENIPYTPKMLADELDFEEATVSLALQALERFEMIVTDGEYFTIAGWEEYQNTDRLAEIREYNRLAKQKEREKKKLLQGVKDNVNDKSMTSQSCQDIEEEGEKDKEQESHSFIHSAREKEDSLKGVENSDIVWEEIKDPDDMGASPALKVWSKGSLGDGYLVMSDIQFHDLLDKLSMDELHRYIDIVVECEKNGKHYKKKSHYQAILDMVQKDRRIAKKG